MQLIPIYKWNKGLHSIKLSRVNFMSQPWAAGGVLLACVIVAMTIANIPQTAHIYHSFLETKLEIHITPPGFDQIVLPENMTVEKFINDILNGELERKIGSAVEERFGRHTPASEMRAWTNSLGYMGTILSTSSIPDNAGVAIEYNIPYTSKRVDLIVSGYDGQGRNSAIIVELKQWEKAETVSGKD